MKNFIQLYKSKGSLFKLTLLFALLCMFPLTGSDCENGIIGSGVTGDIVGAWQLTSMTGYLQDICEGEVVTYDSNGTATLQCPNSNAITRTYTVSNNILTYTETGVQYNITTLSNNTLVLEGRNIGRTLSYSKIPADKVNSSTNTHPKSNKNSSELHINSIKEHLN